MWSANLPEEAPWYAVRIEGPWLPVSIALFLLKFLVPFAFLLSRDLKRKPKVLAGLAAYILVVHFLDILWMVLPSRYPGAVSFSPVDLLAWAGVGGLGLAAITWLLRRGYSAPVKDPYLNDSLRYVQP